MRFKDTAAAYHRMAPLYDQRWRRYLQQTLCQAARYVEGTGPFRLLDVGCGTGELIRLLLDRFPQVDFIGVDAARGMLKEAQAKLASSDRVALHCAGAERLPFADEQFDWVTCCNSLHCFREPEQAIGEMTRVLKPQGRLLLIDWSRDFWACRLANGWCAWFDPTHVWMYTANEIRQMLERNRCLVTRTDRFRVPWPDGLRLWEMLACLGIKR